MGFKGAVFIFKYICSTLLSLLLTPPPFFPFLHTLTQPKPPPLSSLSPPPF